MSDAPDTEVLSEQPGSVAPLPVDAGSPPASNDDEVVEQPSPEPLGPGALGIAACTLTRNGCVTLYIAVTDPAAESCLQLTLDDCGETTRPGLAVDLPLSWRLGSGFVSALADACVPGTQFDPNNTSIGSGTGSISWNTDTRQPSQLVLDVTLQPLATGDDNSPISVSNSDLVDPLLECEG